MKKNLKIVVLVSFLIGMVAGYSSYHLFFSDGDNEIQAPEDAKPLDPVSNESSLMKKSLSVESFSIEKTIFNDIGL